VTPLLLSIFPIAMLSAAATDLATMTIPNRLVAALGAGFLAFALLSGWSAPAIGLHLVVGLAALAITFGFFSAGWMGGGDAKLVAATALWLGPGPDLMRYAVLASIFGGLLTALLIGVRLVVRPTTGFASADRLLDRASGIPYGVALGAAGMVVFAEADWSLPLRMLFG
jgi:prepilin peptidase CpaA